MNSSPPASDPGSNLPVFFTGCVSPDLAPKNPRSYNKSSVAKLSPKDFKNLQESLDTLLSNNSPGNVQTNFSTRPQRRSLLPLPTNPDTYRNNGELQCVYGVEHFEEPVANNLGTDNEHFAPVNEHLLPVNEHLTPKSEQQFSSRSEHLSSANDYSNFNQNMKKPRILFPDQNNFRRDMPFDQRHLGPTGSPMTPQPSHTSASPTSTIAGWHRLVDQEPKPIENATNSRKRKGILPYPEERNKHFRPNLTPPNVWEQLSDHIWKLYHEKKQSQEVLMKKMALRNRLHDMLRSTFPVCGLYVVGSSMTGLAANSSDMDMCLMLSSDKIDQNVDPTSVLRRAFNVVAKYDFLRDVQLIPAKVPILRFKDFSSCIEVDLNVNNSVGIRNTQLLNSYARIDKRVPPLILLVKMWARQHNINDAKFHTLSSYSLALMVIHYLQYACSPPVVPCLQKLQPEKFSIRRDVHRISVSEELPNFISENRNSVGDLFLGFLDYFANKFRFANHVMSVRTGSILPIATAMNVSSPKNKKGHWKYVCIEEPFELTNTACSVFKESAFHYIQNAFLRCWNMLKTHKRLEDIMNVNI